MGVDISHIIRHDFRQVGDRIASSDFVKKTIERLKKNLFIQDIDVVLAMSMMKNITKRDFACLYMI